MMDSFFDSICKVGVFVICAQAMVHFKPREVYEKYLRYLVSIMVLIQLFVPLGSFLLGEGNEKMMYALSQFESKLQNSKDGIEESMRLAEERLESMTLEEVQKQVGVEAAKEQTEKGTIEVEQVPQVRIGD